jgi:hypothetical protein
MPVIQNFGGSDTNLSESGPYFGKFLAKPDGIEVQIDEFDPVVEEASPPCILPELAPPAQEDTGTSDTSDPKTEIEGPNTPSQSLPAPKGTFFFDPECEACCHPEQNKAENFYKTMIMAVSNPKIIKAIKRGEIDIAMKFASTRRGTREGTDLGIEIQSFNMAQDARVSGTRPDLLPIPIRTGRKTSSSTRAYKFIKKLKFKVDLEKVENLTLFGFTYLDPKEMNNAFPELKLDDIIVNTIRSTIKYIDVKVDGQFPLRSQVELDNSGTIKSSSIISRNQTTEVLNCNLRNTIIYDKLVKLCSTELLEKITYNGSSMMSTVAHREWISQRSPETNSMIFGIDYLSLIKNNSLISSILNDNIYKSALIKHISITKKDSYDPDRELVLVQTADDDRRVLKPFTNLQELEENPEIIAAIEEIDLQQTNNRTFNLLDSSNNCEKFSYEISLSFEDPTISLLAKMITSLSKSVDDCNTIYSKIKSYRQKRSASKKLPTSILLETKQTLSSIVSKMIRILTTLAPSQNFDRQQFIDYISIIANPLASEDDHNLFLALVGALTSTLEIIAKTAKIVSSSDEQTSDKEKDAANQIRTVSYKTSEFSTVKRGLEFVVQTPSKTDATLISKQEIVNRGKQEVLKFWNEIPVATELPQFGSIVSAAIKNFTPIKIYGFTDSLLFPSSDSFDEKLETKINNSRLLLDGKEIRKEKATKASRSPLEGLSDISFSIEGVPNNFTFNEQSAFMNPAQSSNNKRDKNRTPIADTNFLNITDNNSDIRESVKYSNTNGLSNVLDIYTESGLTTVFESNSKEINSIEEEISSSSIESLPPSYQSYALKTNQKSKFNSNSKFSSLDKIENSTFVKNYMNIIVKVQVASFTNMYDVEWRDISPDVVKEQKNMLCRLLFINDNRLEIDNTKFEGLIYNQYFLLGDPRIGKMKASSTVKEVENLVDTSSTENGINNAINSATSMNSSFHSSVYQTIAV